MKNLSVTIYYCWLIQVKRGLGRGGKLSFIRFVSLDGLPQVYYLNTTKDVLFFQGG